MSDTDGFIDEVNEELRRDKLYATMRRYGWIAVLVVVAVVGGAAYSEYSKASARAEAQALGDAILTAMDDPDAATRSASLAAIDTSTTERAVILSMLTSAEQTQHQDIVGAVASLMDVANSAEGPEIYRLIARFKALTLQSETLDAAALAEGYEALAQPGTPLRMLAEEQLALLEVAQGNVDAALSKYQSILADAEVTPDLQQRALQVIVALGGEPDLGGSPDLSGAGAGQSDTN